MISVIDKLFIIHQQTGWSGIIRRLISYLQSRWLIISGIINQEKSTANALRVLSKQSGDPSSVEALTQLLELINQKNANHHHIRNLNNIRILLPNYLVTGGK